MATELFEEIMKNAPVYPCSDEGLKLIKDYITENELDPANWKNVTVTRPSKLNLERLQLGESFCLTHFEFSIVTRRRFENIMDYWRRTKNCKFKIALINHESLLVYEVVRVW
jgi:hypothetical protein